MGEAPKVPGGRESDCGWRRCPAPPQPGTDPAHQLVNRDESSCLRLDERRVIRSPPIVGESAVRAEVRGPVHRPSPISGCPSGL